MKAIKFILWGLTALAVASAAVYLMSAFGNRSIHRITISILKQVPQTVLVLETTEELVLARVNRGNWLLGPRKGHATAVRRTHWACDLAAVSPADIEVRGKTVRIRIPDPKVFDTQVDPQTLDIITKRSGLQAVREWATGRRLERRLKAMVFQAPPVFSSAEIRDRRQAFVARLNRQVAVLFRNKGLAVEFR